MFCSCCGSQDVAGRQSCWRCSTLFSSVTANNGADQIQIPGNHLGATSRQFIPTRNPEIPRCWCCQRVYRMRLPALAIHKGGSASIAAPSGILGLWEELELVLVESRVVFRGFPIGAQCSFTPGGPRIQGGYILPSNPGPATFSIHTP